MGFGVHGQDTSTYCFGLTFRFVVCTCTTILKRVVYSSVTLSVAAV